MKSRLIIISDLWGFDNSLWIKNYIEILNFDFELAFYNSQELAGIDGNNLSEKKLHSKFINGRINRAVKKLQELENGEIDILSFSIGGTIAWKASLEGLKAKNLFAISSTRLRYETEKPTCNIQLIFGENDNYKPSDNWATNLNLKMNIVKDVGHDIYTKSNIINEICEQIKAHHNKIPNKKD